MVATGEAEPGRTGGEFFRAGHAGLQNQRWLITVAGGHQPRLPPVAPAARDEPLVPRRGGHNGVRLVQVYGAFDSRRVRRVPEVMIASPARAAGHLSARRIPNDAIGGLLTADGSPTPERKGHSHDRFLDEYSEPWLNQPGHLGMSGGSQLRNQHLLRLQSARTRRDAVEAVFDVPYHFLDTSNPSFDGESGGSARSSGAAAGCRLDLSSRTSRWRSAARRLLRRAGSPLTAEESLFERLGLDHFELLHLHDPEVMPVRRGRRAGRSGGRGWSNFAIGALALYIGVAGGNLAEMAKYVATGAFDRFLLTHDPLGYTLLDRSAEAVIDAAGSPREGVINAAPNGGGMLAERGRGATKVRLGLGDTSMAGSEHDAPRASGTASAAGSDRHAVLDEDSRIDSTVVGPCPRPARVAQTAALLNHAIPTALCDELEALTPPRELWIR